MLRIQIEIDRENRLAELGELAASVAHELRNPLATINISAFNLKKKIRGQDRLKHLARIKRKIEEANLIIDNLLSYSRLKPPRKEDCSLYRKISEVAGEILENRRIDRGKLKLDIDPLMDITILADPHQIGEILANLLNNAFNAIAETGGRVIVRGCVRDENAEVIVDDNGVGIEPEDLERIFDPFFSTRPNGTGLGLPICRQIIRGHGGSIEIDSEKGEGTSVKLSIPVSE
jgi:signal transduction histidine kinase